MMTMNWAAAIRPRFSQRRRLGLPADVVELMMVLSVMSDRRCSGCEPQRHDGRCPPAISLLSAPIQWIWKRVAASAMRRPPRVIEPTRTTTDLRWSAATVSTPGPLRGRRRASACACGLDSARPVRSEVIQDEARGLTGISGSSTWSAAFRAG
jgi:hypothetical protein